jgi:ComF family protein
VLQTLLNMIYPPRCPICDDIIIPKGNMACPACKKKPSYIQEPRCKKCSKPIEREEQEYCNDCLRKNYSFDQGYAVWIYDKTMKGSISKFKYHGRKEYVSYYIDEMLQGYQKQLLNLALDVIVPVPIHRSRHLERGYNQAELLAQGIGKALKLPVLSELLLRNKKTLPQKGLSDKERLKNLEQAFEFNDKLAMNYQGSISRVLLVDDIYTTGATIEACSKLLRRHGIHEVYFIVLCIGKGY